MGAVVAGLPVPPPLQLLLACRRRRLPLARLVHQDLLPPALLAAEPLVASIHVHVLVRAELPLAEVAGLEEAAGEGVAMAVARASGGARPHHLLQDYVRRVRVPVPAVVVMVVVVHQDLEPHDEALAFTLACMPAAHGHGRRSGDDADAVVHGGGASATLLPEVEDALPSWQHGDEER